MKTVDKKALESYKKYVQSLSTISVVDANESKKTQSERIEKAKKDYNFFVNYYFPHYTDNGQTESAPFHIDAANEILKDPFIWAVLEWPREHAKSVHSNVMIPMWLMLHNELNIMVLISKSQDNACDLLSSLQAELEGNNRYIHDFGEQYNQGHWTEGSFQTKSGKSFFALGRGQSPRGLRVGANRPDYCVIDDIDDDEIVLNEKRVDKVVKWLYEALYPAMSIKKSRTVLVGNRIHKRSILACVVGDINPGDAINEKIWHSKIFACTIKRGKKIVSWLRYTVAELERKFSKMPYASVQKEYFHNPIQEGKIFKTKWIKHRELTNYKLYKRIVVYCDPSFTESATSDFKAFSAWAKLGSEYHKLDCFCRICSIAELVSNMYDYEVYLKTKGVTGEYYIEKQFYNKPFLDEFKRQGKNYGFQLRIRMDKRSKPNKQQRIEAMSPLYENGHIVYNELNKNKKDTLTANEQLILFEPGSNTHDDGPDADEGALFKLDEFVQLTPAKKPIYTKKTKQRH